MHQLRQSVHVLGGDRAYYFLRKSLIIRVFQILEVLVLLKNRSLAFLYGARPKSLLGIHLGKVYLRLLLGLFRFLGFGIRSLGAILRSLAAFRLLGRRCLSSRRFLLLGAAASRSQRYRADYHCCQNFFLHKIDLLASALPACFFHFRFRQFSVTSNYGSR